MRICFTIAMRKPFFKIAVITFLIVLSCGCVIKSLNTNSSDGTPRAISNFLRELKGDASGENMRRVILEQLWLVYPESDNLKQELMEYVQNGPDGPGLVFAGVALIPFHDPQTIKPIVDRIISSETSDTARWWLLNSIAYIFAMGDIFPGDQGDTYEDIKYMAEHFNEIADEASQVGLGHFHAKNLKDVYASSKDNPDYGLLVWHTSAYLVGTLDLKDEELISPLLLDSDNVGAFANMMHALSLAANRDFLADLQGKDIKDEDRKREELAAANKAIDWWRAYLIDNPSGDWLPAVISGFQEAGYAITMEDINSKKTKRELLRILKSRDEILMYNAYRLLNHVYKTNFDLERIFNYGGYAGSFLFEVENVFGTAGQMHKGRLKAYWEKRLLR